MIEKHILMVFTLIEFSFVIFYQCIKYSDLKHWVPTNFGVATNKNMKCSKIIEEEVTRMTGLATELRDGIVRDCEVI